MEDPDIEFVRKEHEATYHALVERLRQLGYEPDSAAFGITWGELALTLVDVLFETGRSVATLPSECLVDCMQKALKALQNHDTLPWQWTAQIVMSDVIAPAAVPESDDEGPLTEEYENWSRIEDGWLDAAFEERFEIDDF
jgi:hypothetical protein